MWDVRAAGSREEQNCGCSLCRAGRCAFLYGQALVLQVRGEVGDRHFVLQAQIMKMNLAENDQGYQMHWVFFP